MATVVVIGAFMTGCGQTGTTTTQTQDITTNTTANTSANTKDIVVDNREKTSSTNASNNGEITEEKAKQIALEHAGVKESDVTAIQIKQDYDDGSKQYEIEFYTADKKYEYDIKADDGTVLKVDYETIRGQNTNGTKITEEEAKKIALAKVKGATEKDIFIKMDSDDGMVLYEGEIRHNNKEYEFEIDAYTGDIVKWEEDGLFD